MKKAKKAKRITRRSLDADPEHIAFEFYECVNSMLRDLRAIDLLCPAESSRDVYGWIDGKLSSGDINKVLLVTGRKNDFIGYIQTICRDHIAYAEELIAKGWTPKQRVRHR